MEDTAPRFQAHLQRGGIGLSDMRRLLEAFAAHGDLEKLEYQALKENLLAKTSDHAVKAMLSAFKRRFLQPVGLPPARLVADAMLSPLPEGAKNQILFPYFVSSDPLVETCYRDLVLPRLNSLDSQLARREVQDYLIALSDGNPELKEWSDYMLLRWSRAFLTLLRRFGLVGHHPDTQLRRLWLLPESFAFFWLWFRKEGGSFWEAERGGPWALLQLDERSKEELLTEGQLRGWWAYQRLGDIVEFQPRFSNLEEWMDSGLA